MLVKDVMHRPVLTLDPTVSLGQAYTRMLEHNIRHIPVLQAGKLVGMITDRDLRLATSSFHPGGPRPPETPIGEIMSQPPITGDPLDPVEEAARTMREHKIGALPILEGETLVGIVTGIDLLEALLRLTGVTKPSGRLEVRLPDHPGELARLTGFLANKGLNVHSLLTYPSGPEGVLVVARVGTPETRALAEELRHHGFEVRWPPDKFSPGSSVS